MKTTDEETLPITERMFSNQGWMEEVLRLQQQVCGLLKMNVQLRKECEALKKLNERGKNGASSLATVAAEEMKNADENAMFNNTVTLSKLKKALSAVGRNTNSGRILPLFSGRAILQEYYTFFV